MAKAGKEKISIVKVIDHSIFALNKRSDGIVVEVSIDNAWFTIKEAREVVAAMQEITGGVPHLVVFIPGKHAALDKEARSFMATPEALAHVRALAIVQASVSQQVMSKLYLQIDHPKKPIKVFSNSEEAILWLKTQD